MLELDVQRAGSPEGKVDVKWAEKMSWHWVETVAVSHRRKMNPSYKVR